MIRTDDGDLKRGGGGVGWSSEYSRLRKVIISTFQQTTSNFYKCLLVDISKIENTISRNSSSWKIKYD